MNGQLPGPLILALYAGAHVSAATPVRDVQNSRDTAQLGAW